MCTGQITSNIALTGVPFNLLSPSQFFVTCAPAPFLDDKHVVFGKLIDGWVVMRKIENVPTDPGNRPKLNVIITQCGEM